jgi:hypothetical protein
VAFLSGRGASVRISGVGFTSARTKAAERPEREFTMQSNWVSVSLRCKDRWQRLNLCVQVSRGVPPELRCQPGGGSASGSGPDVCGECTRLLSDPARLREVVEDLTRRGWSDHVKAGAVVVAC